MTQAQFNKKFTKKAFTAFMKGLGVEDFGVINIIGNHCFFGEFVHRIFKTVDYTTEWSEISIDGVRYKYPEWAVSYLRHLKKLVDVQSYDFKKAARDSSVEFLETI